jgi:hypothetical protein
LFQFFLKLPSPHISEKREIFLARLMQNTGKPDEVSSANRPDMLTNSKASGDGPFLARPGGLTQNAF